MVIGILSIMLAALSVLPCFVPGVMSIIGVILSLVALLISCFSTVNKKLTYLGIVLIIVTFNIFIVSEFSFALSKNMYSHTQTPLRKVIYLFTYDEKDKQREQNDRKSLEALGYKVNEPDYKSKEEGYWIYVKTVIYIIFFPYLISIYCFYDIWRTKNT